MFHVALPPHQCPFCLMIYGFAHTFQREAWSLSDGVSAGFIGFDPPTTSTICTNLATLVRLCIHLCFKWYSRTGATTVISLMYFFRLTSEIFFFPPPLAKGQGDRHHTSGLEMSEVTSPRNINKPMNKFCCIFSTLQIPCPPPASPSLGVWAYPLPLFRILC